MEVAESRRRPHTYGRATRKILVHDLFNIGSKNDHSLYEPVHPPTVDNFTRTRTGTPLSEFSEDLETSRQLQHELQASFDLSRGSSAALSVRSQSRSPVDRPSPALFELQSSEDEVLAPKKAGKTYKRRRVNGASSARTNRTMQKHGSSSPRWLEGALASQLDNPAPLDREKSAENRALAISHDLFAKVNDPRDPKPMSPLKPPPTSYPNAPRSPISIDSPASEKSTESMRSARSTPKRKRETSNDVLSDMSSPSQLELSSLRLTPRRHGRSKARSTDLDRSDSSMASPSRNGRRMVDRLDSPRSLSKTGDTGQKSVSPRPAKARKLALEPGALALQSQHPDFPKRASQPQLPQNESGLANPAGQKVRMYGKQRSHLKDMSSGLDNPPQPSSQISLQPLVSMVDSMANTKDAFDVESEDDEPGTKLKSIHELRQAGVANRFHRDLGTLLEDIESTNKVLRIQGLMHLVRKLQEQAFKRMLLESGELLRITSISRPDLDLTSTSVLLLGLWTLAVSDTATAQALSQIYHGILHLPVQIVEETRSIFRIARDRKENLSKALVRDLCDFEGYVVDQSLSAGRQTSKNIIISRVALRSLEYILKRLVELAEPVPEPPANLVEIMVHATRNHAQAMNGEDGGVEHLESIRLLMMWLEMTAATSKSAIKSMQATQIGAISQVLAEVMSWAKLRNSSIEQSCIRTAVEFSTGDAIVCEQFAESLLLQAMFAVVEDHFSYLRNGTEESQTEETKLESVILALGCLLNLMDHSTNGRTRMLQLREDNVSQVDVLVTFFKQHVDETDEAISEAQVQLLIPFGYVVLLLCTLCLNDAIRGHIAGNMEGNGMVDLVNKAEVFLSRMQAVDSDSFVDRFGTTVGIVRATLACA